MDISTAENLYVYDVEVFKNFFSFSYDSINSKDKGCFVVYKQRDDREKLIEFLNKEGLILVGYNNLSYDNTIVNYLLTHGTRFPVRVLCIGLYKLSKAIVESSRGKLDWDIRQLQYMDVPYKSIDLMRLNRFHLLGIGLKQIAINLKHHWIQDLPIHYNAEVQDGEVEDIILYNYNDVDITKKLFDASRKAILLRQDIGYAYGVDVMSADKSKIANVILEHYYAEATGQNKDDFKDLRTQRRSVDIVEVLDSKIDFETNTLKKFFEIFKASTIEKKWNPLKKTSTFQLKYEVNFGGKTYDIGVGGLHSRDDARIIEATDDYEIIDADVGSFYPNIMLNLEVCPEHLDRKFIEVLRGLTVERLAAKKLQKTDPAMKTKAETLKITINSVFGKLSSEFFWVYDPKCLFQVTVNGQLYLMSLIEMFEMENIEVLSANTDGVTCKVPKAKKERYLEICKEWEAKYNFELEFTHYSKIIRRNVNNYLAIKAGKPLWMDHDGTVDIEKNIAEDLIKVKGWFEPTVQLEKGYRHPIVTRAVVRYLLDNIDPATTIKRHGDVLDYCLSQKTGQDFDTKEITMLFDELEEIKLQKNNRFYVSNTGSSIVKVKRDSGRRTSLVAKQSLTVLNNLDDKPISKRDINYDWYIEQAWKVIDEVHPRAVQMTLFV